MTDTLETRLTELEIKLMDQDRTVQDLSDMVNRQWQEIEKLTAKLTSAHARIISLEDNMPDGISVEKPPHY